MIISTDIPASIRDIAFTSRKKTEENFTRAAPVSCPIGRLRGDVMGMVVIPKFSSRLEGSRYEHPMYRGRSLLALDSST